MDLDALKADIKTFIEAEVATAIARLGRREEPRPLMTIQDVMVHFGVSESTVYRMVRAGKLQALRVGRRTRFRRADLEADFEIETASGTKG